ncbi:hypothetical protein QDX25_07315 [Auritidibacter ignavus]|uniref:hypothetical protein n=1 Tax=Auritidibacter ignavus TaxID=678932 RepID=UPI00244725AB|nr:hypothetical protein [Auritidibacter ignavus]WGH80617.1 hypothetical protein QDX25_07315 [Auritidibacter ignavus]
MSDVFVGMVDFTRALRTVWWHAATPVDHIDNRIHVRVVADHLLVMATQGYTMGCSRVCLEDVVAEPGESLMFDLSVEQAKELVRAFKPSREEAAMAQLLIRVVASRVVFEDVSGLLPGKRVELPLVEREEFMNMPRLIAEVQAADLQPVSKLRVSADKLKLFTQSAQTAGGDLRFFYTGARDRVLVTSGSSFRWVIGPGKEFVDEQEEEHFRSTEQEWNDLMGHAASEHGWSRGEEA